MAGAVRAQGRSTGGAVRAQARSYGFGDNFDPEKSHVMPALIRKFHEAKVNDAGSVTVWGTSTPGREFCHVDDCAAACLFLMEHYRCREKLPAATA